MLAYLDQTHISLKVKGVNSPGDEVHGLCVNLTIPLPRKNTIVNLECADFINLDLI